MSKKTDIKIDYTLCGDGNGMDPRECTRCLKVCEPAVFLLHQSTDAEENNPCDPEKWRITPLWLSLCTHCMKCVDVCPVNAMKVK
ncbi:MAG: 4Fe-4S dicluster domain-containing protein [Actinobacteria bacterium]|nr:4Fe-4S dicluster domain-containing protein [Actinomycetota bacterium]